MNQPSNPIARIRYETKKAIRDNGAGRAILMLSPIGSNSQFSVGVIDPFGNIDPCCRYDIDTYDSANYCE